MSAKGLAAEMRDPLCAVEALEYFLRNVHRCTTDAVDAICRAAQSLGDGKSFPSDRLADVVPDRALRDAFVRELGSGSATARIQQATFANA